jgi:hypothetical protein
MMVSATHKLIGMSIAIGLAASLLPTLGFMFVPGPFGMRTALPMLISVSFSVTWLVRFVFVLLRHGKKGLWFLIGLPFGVLWPLWVFAIWWACAARWSCF